MAMFIKRNGKNKCRLFGQYEQQSKNGNPMIMISLQIVGKGTREIKIIRWDCWRKAVVLLKDNNIETHDEYAKLLNENIH